MKIYTAEILIPFNTASTPPYEAVYLLILETLDSSVYLKNTLKPTTKLNAFVPLLSPVEELVFRVF